MSTVHIYFSVRSKMESKRNTTYFFKNSTMEGEKARGNFVKRGLHKKKDRRKRPVFFNCAKYPNLSSLRMVKSLHGPFPRY